MKLVMHYVQLPPTSSSLGPNTLFCTSFSNFLIFYNTLKVSDQNEKLKVACHNMLVFLKRQVVSPSPSPKAGGTPFICCPQLHILYIYDYPSHLDVICPICNLRMRHAMVTGDQLV